MSLPAHPFCIALQFLSRLPLSLREAPSPPALGASLLWYPLIGLLFGALLQTLSLLPLPANLLAALLLAVWVLASGGLHLDGLADSADAWVGGGQDRARTLAIMKDPRAGAMAVIAIVLVLLLKYAALQTLLRTHSALLWLAPYLARGAMPALFLSTAYVREAGLGSTLAAQLPRRAARLVCLLVAASCALAGRRGLLVLLGVTALFVLLRMAMLRRLGGFTGDTAGALLELSETLALLILAGYEAAGRGLEG